MKIDFTFVHPRHGKFTDAIHLPDDHAHTSAEIEDLQKARFDKWVATIEAPFFGVVIDVEGEQYTALDGPPLPGATLLEVDGVWYYKG